MTDFELFKQVAERFGETYGKKVELVRFCNTTGLYIDELLAFDLDRTDFAGNIKRLCECFGGE